MIDLSTVRENFVDWDRFTAAYYPVIREAMASLRFVPRDLVDDWTQSFFADKLIAKRLLENPPELRGPFRNWLFTAVKNHARDEARKIRRRGRHEVPDAEAGDGLIDPRPSAIPVIESDALYALTYLAVALRTARRHWEAVGQNDKWRIFDALVLAEADPDVLRPTREQLLGELSGRDAQYLDNCVTTVKRSIRSLLPLVLPAEMSDRDTAGQRFDEWREILGDGQLSALGWLRWAVPADWVRTTASSSRITSTGLAVARVETGADGPALFLDDDSRELPAEMEEDCLRVAQSIILALPFPVYLEGLEAARERGGEPPARGAAGQARMEDTLQALLSVLADGGLPANAAGLLARLRELKRFGKHIHHASTQTCEHPTPLLPRELGQLLYTLACAIALVAAGKRIDTLAAGSLTGNIAWAVKRPWLDARLAPVLNRAHAILAGTSRAGC
jgi:hypothetical protein